MALELYPTPSWPHPAFSIPFTEEHKRFPIWMRWLPGRWPAER